MVMAVGYVREVVDISKTQIENRERDDIYAGRRRQENIDILRVFRAESRDIDTDDLCGSQMLAS